MRSSRVAITGLSLLLAAPAFAWPEAASGPLAGNGPRLVDRSLPEGVLGYWVTPHPPVTVTAGGQPDLNAFVLLDDFNRPDGGLGASWTAAGGSILISGNRFRGASAASSRAIFNSALTTTSARIDVANNATGTAFAGIVLDFGAGTSNLFLKVQNNGGAPTTFTNGACYTGNNGTPFGLGFFTLTAPFNTATMTVSVDAARTVTVTFSNIDGGAGTQTYVCNGAPAAEGPDFGINAFGTTAFGDNFQIDVPCPTITLSPGSPLPNGTAGSAYSQTISASGGAAPYTYAITAGALPAGLSLNGATGEISGTPTTPGGPTSFTITATDASGCTGSQAYDLTIDCPVITVSPATLANGTIGVAYSDTVSASGGTAPYTYAVSAGNLPAGLGLDTNTGVVSGTPTALGTSSFDVLATDANGCTGRQSYTITISCPTITLAPATLPNGTPGVAYSQTVTASGGTAPYTYALGAGTLPAGLSLASATGVISGTPTTPGTSSFDVVATDANGCAGRRSYTITISCGTIVIAPATLPDGVEGLGYSQTLTASGGTAPYTYAVTSGSLPAGIALNGTTGVLSGTPTTAGTSTFAVTATDAGGCTNLTVVAQSYTLTIDPAVDFIVGEGLGSTGGANTNRVRVFNRGNVATTVDFQAYGAANWGTNVSSADVNGAIYGEILTGPGPGDVYGPQVRGFDRLGNPIAKVNFYAYGTLKFGVNVAGGDLDNDGFGEILSGAGPGAVFGPHVRGWNFDNAGLSSIAKISFYAYGTLRYGVNVEEGNVDGDSWSEILTGPGPSAVFNTNVRGFNYDNAAVTQMGKVNFVAHGAMVHGVNVAGGDVDGDGFAELATTPGPAASNPSDFLGWQYDNTAISGAAGFTVTPWGGTLYGGRVNLGDINSDGNWDLLAGRGRDPLADSEGRRYDYNGAALTQTGSILPFGTAGYGFGVNVAGGALGHY